MCLDPQIQRKGAPFWSIKTMACPKWSTEAGFGIDEIAKIIDQGLFLPDQGLFLIEKRFYSAFLILLGIRLGL